MTNPGHPPIVDRAAWDAAMEKQAAEEEQLMQRLEAVAASRRRLPMTPLVGDYTFTGPDGEVPLADVFGGTRQLVVYHFMYAPEWKQGCPHCTEYARLHGPGMNDVLGDRDTRYVLMSRAPYEKLADWARQKDITTPWYSCTREFMEEMEQINDSFGDFPGISVFFKSDDGEVYRSYHSSSGPVGLTIPTTAMLLMTPWGKQEHGEDSPEGWPQRFDAM